MKSNLSFSQRSGLEPFGVTLSPETMPDALRIGLWNVFYLWHEKIRTPYLDEMSTKVQLQSLWGDMLHQPLDEMSYFTEDLLNRFKERYLGLPWNRVYDFVEFDVRSYSKKVCLARASTYNEVLQRFSSAYRFIDDTLVAITTVDEVKEIEEVLSNCQEFKGAAEHLKTALEMLSDRENPDYRNSVKESVSAVESICQNILGDPKITLGKALKVIASHLHVHPALEGSFGKLYGYTSDAGGIRHSIYEAPEKIDQFEAKFMLISCSAFINYLRGKQSNNLL